MNVFASCVLLLLITGGPLLAQPQPAQRKAYLQHINLYDTSLEVESTLIDLFNRHTGFFPASRRAQTAAFFSFVLTLNGYTGDLLQKLQADGLNIVHALTADNRPLVEQALMADFVITGTVVGKEDFNQDTEGSYREIEINIDEILKGESVSDTVIIRQRNGFEYGENPREAAQLDIGNTYLLLLSNGLFRYALFSRSNGTVGEDSDTFRNHYSIYRHYDMSGKRVLWSGYNNRKTRKAFDKIRWLDGYTQ